MWVLLYSFIGGIVDLDRLVSELERFIDELESEGIYGEVQVSEQDRVQDEVRDKGQDRDNNIKENNTDSRDTINMGHVAVATNNVVYTDEIYIIGGYSRLISRLKSKFVNLIYDDKGFDKYIGKDNVFILTGYISHADYYKIDSLGIKGNFVNSKGYNGIVREIVGCIEGRDIV